MSEWIETMGFDPESDPDTMIHIKWVNDSVWDSGEWIDGIKARCITSWAYAVKAYRLAVERPEPSKCEYGHAWQAHDETCKECGMRWRDYRAVREGKQVTINAAAQELAGTARERTDTRSTAPVAAAPVNHARSSVVEQVIPERIDCVAGSIPAARANQRGAAAKEADACRPCVRPPEQSAPHLTREQYENLHGPKREPAFVFSRDRFGFLEKYPEREVTRHAELPLSAWRRWK